ncbi:hypothetical protein AVEN_140337-1 [Araneus ventricosus]|uniref:Uncharacterized protein n=1 Tax=Araneus ventricosus TaxID=182803 RepID=A0A4Y2VHV1_ARAVE|nr:hypothetical protein AVEN_140337-1 [Araneus ventricosus]
MIAQPRVSSAWNFCREREDFMNENVLQFVRHLNSRSGRVQRDVPSPDDGFNRNSEELNNGDCFVRSPLFQFVTICHLSFRRCAPPQLFSSGLVSKCYKSAKQSTTLHILTILQL